MNLIHSTGIEVITDWELFRIALKKKKSILNQESGFILEYFFFWGSTYLWLKKFSACVWIYKFDFLTGFVEFLLFGFQVIEFLQPSEKVLVFSHLKGFSVEFGFKRIFLIIANKINLYYWRNF